jgi:hypothetical protein
MIKLQQDEFWSVSKQREKAVEDLRVKIDYTRKAMATSARVSSIQSHPGFPAFKKALQDMRDARITALTLCTSGEGDMRALQGAVNELGLIITILERAEESEKKLATTAQKLEDQLSQIVGAVPNKEKQ